jgi:drug/metabolite transporter (DMT)-like permease
MKPFLIWLLLCFIWGTTWIAIKIGLADVPPFGFAAVRFAIAPAVLFLFLKLAFPQKSLLPDGCKEWTILALTGLFSFTINYACVFWGEQYLSAGLAALLGATSGPWMLVFAHFIWKDERLDLAKLAGIGAALCGIAIIFANELHIEGSAGFYGCCAGLAASISGGYGAALTKQARLTIFPPAIALWQMIFGCLPLLMLAFAAEGNPLALNWTPRAMLALLYLAVIGSALTFSLYYSLLQSGSARRVSTISLVVPFVSVIIDRGVLDESLTLRQALGGALILAGAALISSKVAVKDVATAQKKI